MARGATVGAYDEVDEDASGDGRAPRWGFRLLGVSVIALTGVVGAISLDLYRHAHPDMPLFDLSRIVGGFGLPESFVERGLKDDLHVSDGSGEVTLSIAPLAQAVSATGPATAPAAASAPVPASAPAPASAPVAASAPMAPDPVPPAAAVAAVTAPPPQAVAPAPVPGPEPVLAMASAAGAAPQNAPPQDVSPQVAEPVAPPPAAPAPAAIGPLAAADPEPAPEPLATRAALAAVADLRRPVLPSAAVAPAEPDNQPTDLPDPLAVRHSLTVAEAVPPATIEMLKPVATVSATALDAVSPVKATAYLDEAPPAPAPAAAAPAAEAESSGGFEIAALPSIFAGLSSISAQAAETSAGLDAMVPPPAPADMIARGGSDAGPAGGGAPTASRPPARGIIFAVEATRLADVVAHGADRHDPVASVVDNASLAAVPMDDDAASGIPTVSSSYIVTPAASLLRPPVDPADVTDVDSRGRGLSSCEEGDDACRAFVAAEDGSLSLPSPVLARYGRNPVVIGGTELSTDPVELERALRCLSFIAYGEAGNQGPRGMAAVIWVIMNRVVEGDVFAPGPCEVIAQTGQFEPMTLNRYDDIAATIKAGAMPPFLNSRGAERILQRTARLVVWQMMDGYFADDPTVGAQYFLAPGAMRALGRSLPDWTNRFTMTAAIGDHNFYRRDGL